MTKANERLRSQPRNNTQSLCDVCEISVFGPTPLYKVVLFHEAISSPCPRYVCALLIPLPQDTRISRFIAFIIAHATAVSVGLTNEQHEKKKR